MPAGASTSPGSSLNSSEEHLNTPADTYPTKGEPGPTQGGLQGFLLCAQLGLAGAASPGQGSSSGDEPWCPGSEVGLGFSQLGLDWLGRHSWSSCVRDKGLGSSLSPVRRGMGRPECVFPHQQSSETLRSWRSSSQTWTKPWRVRAQPSPLHFPGDGTPGLGLLHCP